MRLMGAAICESRRTLVFRKVCRLDVQTTVRKALQRWYNYNGQICRNSVVAHSLKAVLLWKPRRLLFRREEEVTAGHLPAAAVFNSWRQSHFLLPRPVEIFGQLLNLFQLQQAPLHSFSSLWIPNLLEQIEKRSRGRFTKIVQRLLHQSIKKANQL